MFGKRAKNGVAHTSQQKISIFHFHIFPKEKKRAMTQKSKYELGLSNFCFRSLTSNSFLGEEKALETHFQLLRFVLTYEYECVCVCALQQAKVPFFKVGSHTSCSFFYFRTRKKSELFELIYLGCKEHTYRQAHLWTHTQQKKLSL